MTAQLYPNEFYSSRYKDTVAAARTVLALVRSIERRIVDDPEWATLRRVNETREHLLEVLQEAFRD